MSYYVRKSSINHFIKSYTKNKIYDGPDFLPDNLTSKLDNGKTDCTIYSSSQKTLNDFKNTEELCDIIDLCSKSEVSQNTLAVIMATVEKFPLLLFLEKIYQTLEKHNYTEKEKINLIYLLQEITRIAEKRTPLKLGFILAAIIGPATIKEHNRQLFNDLFMIGRCSEFTPYLAICLKLSAYPAPQEELWNIFSHSQYIGQQLITTLLKCNNLQEKESLLKKDIVWMFLSYRPASLIINKVNLTDYLADYNPNPEILARIGKILSLQIEEEINRISPLLPLLQFPFHTFFTATPSAPIGKAAMLFMDHMEKLDFSSSIATVNALISMLYLKHKIIFILQKMPAELYLFMDSNTAQSFLARCDALIYEKNMRAYILDNIIDENGFVIKEFSQLALTAHCNIFPEIYKHYKENKEDLNALKYLEIHFRTILTGPKRKQALNELELLLEDIKGHLNIYSTDEQLMVNLCTTLALTPNHGEDILAAGLESIYESVRKSAALALAEWQQREISSELSRTIRNSYYSSGDKNLKKLLAAIERNTDVKKINA